MYRVRQLISIPDIRTKLVKLIPSSYFNFDFDDFKGKYPSSLIKELPNTYSEFGIITECVLQEDEISLETLSRITNKVSGIKLSKKVLSLKSTIRYLETLQNMKEKMIDELSDNFVYDSVFSCGEIEGHPDIVCSNDICEIKTSCNLENDWSDYILQLLAYVSLAYVSGIQKKYFSLLLPLQNIIIRTKTKKWKKSEKFMEILNEGVQFIKNSEFGQIVYITSNAGQAVSKSKGSFINTLKTNAESERPFQFFLNGQMNTKVTLSENEINESKNFLNSNKHLKPFCHLPYTLSLANRKEDKGDYVNKSLKEYMKTIKKIGIKGGVVHVGKSNNYPVEEATENMKNHILRVLKYCNSDSPLLLETPSGQGNELLTKRSDFLNFCESIESDSFGICLDTCHVFASGYLPSKYIEKILNNENLRSKLKLIHFNDSKGDRGSCVDRHTFIGTGCIPKDEFLKVAYLATLNNIPLIIE